jgi:hypothetical protein
VQADFQITPMLAQELFGLLQGCILGRMPCPHGLTTNGPDHNELLYHVSFPDRRNDHSDGAITFPNRDIAQRIASSTSFRFFLSPGAVPSQEQATSQRRTMKRDRPRKAPK